MSFPPNGFQKAHVPFVGSTGVAKLRRADRRREARVAKICHIADALGELTLSACTGDRQGRGFAEIVEPEVVHDSEDVGRHLNASGPSRSLEAS